MLFTSSRKCVLVKMLQLRLLFGAFLILVQNFEFSGISRANGVVVDTKIGEITGSLKLTRFKRTKHYAFQGIPYAEPPIGKLRFQPPREIEDYGGGISGTKEPKTCLEIQLNNVLKTSGSEDCLYLNIYSSALYKGLKKQPVVVWIHGGFFFGGNSKYDKYGLDYFVDEGIVSVSLNYRLGFLGFHHNGRNIAGNMGIKDQLMALKWVKRHIARFGGDPNSITIMGESAGAACVSYLVQSPLTSGLFQRAIMQSGNSLAGWAIGRDTSRKILDALKSMLTVLDIVSKGLSLFPMKFMSTLHMFAEIVFDPLKGLPFAPVMEKPSPTAVFVEESFIVLDECQEGSFVPIMIGHNSNEGDILTGYSFITRIVANIYNIIYTFKKSGLLPKDMSRRRCSGLGAEVKSYYGLHSPSQLGEFLGDVFFVIPTLQYAHLYSKCNDVYLYRFSYKDAVHGDDLKYLFSNYRLKSDEDEDMSSTMVKLWSNFIRSGNPTPDPDEFDVEWNKSNDENGLEFLNIDRKLEVLNSTLSPHRPELKFWKGLRKRCNRNITQS